MELKEWIDETVPSYKRGAWADKVESEGLMVVGVCKSCRSWSDFTCSNEKFHNLVYSEHQEFNNECDPDFGCRFWRGE